MTTLATAEELRKKLEVDGFCAAGPVVPASILADAHRLGAGLLAGETEASLLALRSLGSLISVFRHPGFAPLICAPSLLSLAGQLGPDPRFSAGYFASKPRGRRPRSGTKIGASGATRPATSRRWPRWAC